MIIAAHSITNREQIVDHQNTIQDQFTRQANPFSDAPAIRNREAIQILVDAAQVNSSSATLDVACGPGLVALAFAEKVSSAIGLDTTQAMLDRAQELQTEAGIGNCIWKLGDAERLPFETNQFDAVTSRFAFHHFLSPQKVLAEMVRACKPGGKIVVCDALASENPQKSANFNDMEKLRDPSTVKFLTLIEMQDLMGEYCANGEKIEQQFYQLEANVSGLLKVSFPEKTAKAKLIHILNESVKGDTLGMNSTVSGNDIKLSYNVGVFSFTKL